MKISLVFLKNFLSDSRRLSFESLTRLYHTIITFSGRKERKKNKKYINELSKNSIPTDSYAVRAPINSSSIKQNFGKLFCLEFITDQIVYKT